MNFERILPIIGNSLKDKTIGIVGLANIEKIVSYLFLCGIKNFKFSNIDKIKICSDLLSQIDENNNCFIDKLKDYSEVDLIISINPKEKIDFSEIIYCGFINKNQFFLGYKEFPDKKTFIENDINYFSLIDFYNQVSQFTISLLLENSEFQRKDISTFLKHQKIIYSGNNKWYWKYSNNTSVIENNDSENISKKDTIKSNLFIIGCGSIGSVIAQTLSPLVSKLILADDKKVSEFNPVRQEYNTKQIRKEKVFALKENILRKNNNLKIKPLNKSFNNKNIQEFNSILDKELPDIVILCTGSTDDNILAHELWKRKIPHLSIKCYPRAKWFEIIFVIPKYNTPCLNCLRGNLFTGEKPELTPEQEEKYDPFYIQGELESEPATKIDSGRAAEISSRLIYELLTNNKETWIKTLIKYNKTCLLGGNRVETKNSYNCYGINQPGQLVAFGLENINSSSNKCMFCKRDNSKSNLNNIKNPKIKSYM